MISKIVKVDRMASASQLIIQPVAQLTDSVKQPTYERINESPNRNLVKIAHFLTKSCAGERAAGG
jgi:hypothetical protein